jgi:hypothetical protein
VTDGIEGTTKLQRKAGHDSGILSQGFHHRTRLGGIHEQLGNAAIGKPADAADVSLTVTLKPIDLMLPSAWQACALICFFHPYHPFNADIP